MMEFRTFYINKKQIKYQELTAQSNVFEKFYLIENYNQDDIVAIPDGCIDIQFVWNEDACCGYLCGSFLQGKHSGVSHYRRCFGMKLKPGIQFSFMPRNTKELLESRILLSSFLDIGPLEKKLNDTDDFITMISFALHFFEDQRVEPANQIASSTIDLILNESGVSRVTEIANSLGYSQRHVNNIFRYYFGIPVKKFSDIVRAQIAIKSIESENIMDIVQMLGYYDQAHFIHDFKQYTSLTPKSYLERAKNEGKIIV